VETSVVLLTGAQSKPNRQEGDVKYGSRFRSKWLRRQTVG